MSLAEFQTAITRAAAPPREMTPALAALWHDARGDWERAHACAQADQSRQGSWVHAYLHRKEGDRANAGYWYSRAGRPMPGGAVSLAAEWEEIASALLAD